MKSHLFRSVALTGIILFSGLIAATPSQADDDGRYRAIVLHEGGASGSGGSLTPRVFLIDSKEGHMWIWERNIPLLGPDKQSFGTMLTYQGRLKPGEKVGEIIYQEKNTP
jgi:hypothetical protein